jgi:hypothetical protein
MSFASRHALIGLASSLVLMLCISAAGCAVSTGGPNTGDTQVVELSLSGSSLRRLVGDIPAAGVQVLEASGGPGTSGHPVPLFLKVLSGKGQDATAYQAIADKLLSLALPYKQALYFDTVQVVIATSAGEILYSHTFQVAPPESTTSSTQGVVTYYSSPGLRVTPREGISLEANVNRGSDGTTIQVIVHIANDSSEPFAYSASDVRLYLDGSPIGPTDQASDELVLVAPGSGDNRAIYFTAPDFDPNAAGLLYVSSDPGSAGFTAGDGQVPGT